MSAEEIVVHCLEEGIMVIIFSVYSDKSKKKPRTKIMIMYFKLENKQVFRTNFHALIFMQQYMKKLIFTVTICSFFNNDVIIELADYHYIVEPYSHCRLMDLQIYTEL